VGGSNLGTFNIIINPDATLASNAPALAAFNRAAAQWEGFISDPINVNVDASLAPLGAGIIGSTSSVALQAGYNTIRNQLVADAALNDADDGILNSLPTAVQFTATVPAGRSLNGTIVSNKAALKAAGFTGLDTSFGNSDGMITFSTNFSFDFDNSNGVSAGQMDFETVAAHEIGHLLGFTSSVDDVDFGATTFGPTTLDLLRFRNQVGQKPTSSGTFTTMARSYVPGADELTSDVATENRMSTGVLNGDGRQASHWKADELTGNYIGIMDPTLALGQIEQITAADRRAMDLIGYEIVIPEPSTFAACGMLSLLALRRVRRPHRA
jgi:hypothetical protein